MLFIIIIIIIIIKQPAVLKCEQSAFANWTEMSSDATWIDYVHCTTLSFA